MVQKYFLNKDLHVFENCVDTIEEISDEIFSVADLNQNGRFVGTDYQKEKTLPDIKCLMILAED